MTEIPEEVFPEPEGWPGLPMGYIARARGEQVTEYITYNRHHIRPGDYVYAVSHGVELFRGTVTEIVRNGAHSRFREQRPLARVTDDFGGLRAAHPNQLRRL